MIRTLAAALLLLAAPAAAQTPAATPELTRATHAIAALWRPHEGEFSADSVRAACAGASEELRALDAAMPSELNADSAARVRGLRGLHVIPIAERPGTAYFFPPLGMTWFTPGLGVFAVRDEQQGFIDVRDAGGQALAVQRVRAGNLPVLRIRVPGTDRLVTFVGCQPIAPL
jgi:hypothetical protein